MFYVKWKVPKDLQQVVGKTQRLLVESATSV
ncbi:hypothetical protein AEYBE204_09925 [Asticcacaulis sp. YBE204]|nr:hypothetical protein AEYBE204_09925 [Asticcacaulis sp. YBE204]